MGAITEMINDGFVINERFQIKRVLGQGGFAMVFEGIDINLDRAVAIKVLHGALTNTGEDRQRDVIDRFEREARLAASVEHPSIVNIYDVGEIDELGEPFIVMEYLRGRSFADQLEDHGAMEAEVLLPLYKDLLLGMGFAHEAGIVHKDLKPENIFYRHPDTIRESLCVVDFGIAHIGRSNSQRVTRDGEFFGTPSYMAPEYISDQKVSPALDVYQLGLILVEGLTGHVLIDHPEPVATLLAHLSQNYIIPRCILESPLGPVIEKSLAPIPKDRYRDAMEFAEALAKVDPASVPDMQTILREYETGLGLGEETLAEEEPPMGSSLGDEPSDIDTTNVSKWVHESEGYSRTIPGLGGLLPPDIDAPDWNSNPTPYGGFAAISQSMRKEVLDPQGLEEPVGLGFAPTEPADDSMLPSPNEHSVGERIALDETVDQVDITQSGHAPDKPVAPARTRSNSSRETAREEKPAATPEAQRESRETEKISSRTHISAPLARPPAVASYDTEDLHTKTSSKLLPFAAVGLLLLGVLLLGVAMMLDDEDGQNSLETTEQNNAIAAARDTSSAETTATTAISPPEDVAAVKEDEAKDTTPAAEEAPAAKEIELVSLPARAKVFQDGTFMGQTPYTVTFEADTKDPITFSLRYKGYEDLEVTVGPGDGPSSEHEMQRKKEKPRKVRSGDSKKPRETTPPEEEKPKVLLPK